jgi:hypothetical protein
MVRVEKAEMTKAASRFKATGWVQSGTPGADIIRWYVLSGQR